MTQKGALYLEASGGEYVATAEGEKQALIEQFEGREAGVLDLFEFYTRVEALYAAASKAIEEGHVGTSSNSANLE